MRVKDPIQYLRDEHEHALAALDRLERGANNLGSASDALSIVRDAVRFIDHEVRHHNEREEKVLFPRLAEEKGPVDVMLQEHRELWTMLDRLQGSIQSAMEDPTDGSRYFAEIRAEGLDIVTLLRAHIEKENKILFRIAEEIIPPEEKLKMAEEMERLIEEEASV